MESFQKIAPSDLVRLADFEKTHPLRVDLVYSKPDHPRNVFKSGIYHKEAQMWTHRDLAPVILRAAEICHAESGYIFETKDSLRTMEAQALMCQSPIVKSHPEWLEEPSRLLSPPGKGGHPRGMAVDIILIDANGEEVDMGTPFDYLTTDRTRNPAARNFTGFSPAILANRQLLEKSMLAAAQEFSREIVPLPQEWWDFRFPAAHSSLFAPLSDAELPPEMKMTAP